MIRREFIAGLGSAVAWPFAVGAQQRIPAVGLLSGVSFGAYAPFVEEIRQGLKDVGFVEGQDTLIEYRSADGHPERVKDLADDLVRRQVAVIVAIAGSNVALAAKAATPTIPIVFAAGGDALENGLVKNFNKPEANVTGMSFNTRQMAPSIIGRYCLSSGGAPLGALGALGPLARTSDQDSVSLCSKATSPLCQLPLSNRPQR